MCSIDEYANIRLMSRRRYSMNAAKIREISPIVTMSGPGVSARAFAAMIILNRRSA